jgi:chromosome segregation ATPase
MTDDLVKRLRYCAPERRDCSRNELAMLDAADRIEKLEAALQRANANVEEYERKFYLGTDRIEKLEAALREIAQTVTIVDENWHPSYHDFSFTQKQAEGAYEELGRRIQIARKALEKKDG